MNSFWILMMTFWMGGCVGFLLFALMQVTRDATEEHQREVDPLPFAPNDRN